MNIYSFSGNVGSDAVLRYTSNNKAVTQFSVGVSTGYGDNRKTVWVRCSVWDKQAELANDVFKKGTKFAGTGEITATSYADKSGVEKPSLEVRIISFDLPAKQNNQQDSTQYQPAKESAPQSNDMGGFEQMEDDVPF